MVLSALREENLAKIEEENNKKQEKETKTKTKGRSQVSTTKIQNKKNYMMHEQIK